jgi:hypothetical protein
LKVLIVKYPIDKIEIDIDGMLIELIDNNFSKEGFY